VHEESEIQADCFHEVLQGPQERRWYSARWAHLKELEVILLGEYSEAVMVQGCQRNKNGNHNDRRPLPGHLDLEGWLWAHRHPPKLQDSWGPLDRNQQACQLVCRPHETTEELLEQLVDVTVSGNWQPWKPALLP